MIFPELPKRGLWHEQITDSRAKTPLHIEEQSAGIDIELWFEQHGLPSKRTDPAARVNSKEGTQINWLAGDAWELYMLIAGMITWTVYWRGVHVGAW